MRIYIASPLSCSEDARQWASDLRDNGCHITSRWHDIVLEHDAVDPTDETVRRSTLDSNLCDLLKAQCVLALMRTGVPRATNCEIGFAIGRGIPVIWFAGPSSLNTNLFASHPLVQFTRSSSNALHLILELAKQTSRR